MLIRPSMDFRMSIGVEPMKMRTDRGIVITATGPRRGPGGT